MNCVFDRFDAEGLWVCGACGRQHRIRLARAPRRVCTSAQQASRGNAARLARDIEAAVLNRWAGLTAAEIERRLAVCRSEGCREKFTGYGCRNCTCRHERAWFAGLILDAAAERRWVCRLWVPTRDYADE
jgi:hypothetical protein